MWFSTSIQMVRDYMKDPQPLIEELKFRVSERRKLKDQGKLPVQDRKWMEAFTFFVADVIECIETGIKIREEKKTWWERWGKRAVKLLEAGFIIVAGIYAKKLPF
jgi:hypothetical protein